MITVHYLNESRAHRIVWLLEELGVLYTIVRYTRDPKTRRAPEALRKIHPLGKSPVIQEGARVVAESGAIIEYLIEAHGGEEFAPAKGTDAYFDYRYWMHYAEGSAMPILFLKYVLSVLPVNSPFLARPVVKAVCARAQSAFTDPQIRMHMEFWETSLKKTGWFAGDAFTAADIQMSYPVESAMSRIGGAYPAITDWMRRIHARPTYEKALVFVEEETR